SGRHRPADSSIPVAQPPMTTRRPDPADSLANLTRRVVEPLRIIRDLDEVLCERLEIAAGDLAAVLAPDPRATDLQLLSRFTDVAKDLAEQLRTEHGHSLDAGFWTARQELDDRVFRALGGTPAVAPPTRAPPAPTMTDDEIAVAAAEVADTLRLRDERDQRELQRQARAAGRTAAEYKRELA